MAYVAVEQVGRVSGGGPVGGDPVTTAANGYVPPALAPGGNPVLSITSPANGATITESSVVFIASASDGDGIASVAMYVDDVLEATETVAPYGWGGGDGIPPFDLTGYANGPLAFKAIATDNLDNTTEVTNTITLAIPEDDPGTPGTADYFISPSGNDSTGSGTSGSPWKTIAKAYSEASPGDVVEMAGGTYPSETVAYNAGKVVTFTLPTEAGQSDDRWGGAGPVTFRAASGGTVAIGNLTLPCAGIEFDGGPGALSITYIFASSTTRFVLRDASLKQSLDLNAPAAYGFVDCIVGQGRAENLDVIQTKGVGGVGPRNFYSMRTVFLSAYKPAGSTVHVDTIQIGEVDGLWFEDSIVLADTTPQLVQGFFARGWTGPTENATCVNCWFAHCNVSEPDTYVVFEDCTIGSGGFYDAGFGEDTGTTFSSVAAIQAAYDGGARPWIP